MVVYQKMSWDELAEENFELKAKILKQADALRMAKILLSIAKCPACDGSGTIPHQVGDDDWEAEQCQWCYEKQTALNQIEEA